MSDRGVLGHFSKCITCCSSVFSSWWGSAVKLQAVSLSGVYSDLHGVHPGLVSVRGRVHVVSLGLPRAQPHQHLHAALRQIRQLLQPSDLLRPELQVPARRERAAALRRRGQRRRQAQALQEDQGQDGRPEMQSRGAPPTTQEAEPPRLSPGGSAPCRWTGVLHRRAGAARLARVRVRQTVDSH